MNNEKLFCPFLFTLQGGKKTIQTVNSLEELIRSLAQTGMRIYVSGENKADEVPLGCDEVYEVYSFDSNGKRNTLGWCNFFGRLQQ